MTLTNNRPLIFDNRVLDECKVGINKKTGPEATLDVNGDTKINGKIGVGSTGDFGTAGAVLTSNGSGSAVSWNAPILFTVYKSSNSTSSNPVINWETPEINIGGGTWNGAGTYTVGLAGYYDLNFQAQIQTTTPNTVANFIAIRVNGARVSEANQFMVNVENGDEYLNMVVSKLKYLYADDYITTEAVINDSGVINNSHLKIIRVA